MLRGLSLRLVVIVIFAFERQCAAIICDRVVAIALEFVSSPAVGIDADKRRPDAERLVQIGSEKYSGRSRAAY